MSERVKCPTCEAEGRRSRAYPGITYTTDMYFAPYYDEDGVYHHHDANSRTSSYRCSNGHEWMEAGVWECPAGDWRG